jgi:hypothetical protein
MLRQSSAQLVPLGLDHHPLRQWMRRCAAHVIRPGLLALSTLKMPGLLPGVAWRGSNPHVPAAAAASCAVGMLVLQRKLLFEKSGTAAQVVSQRALDARLRQLLFARGVH